MGDTVSFVGRTIPTEEATELQARIDALGWRMQTRPAGHGQVRIVRITAPALPEDEPAQAINEEFSSLFPAAPAPGSGLRRSDRELAADHDQPALLIAG